MTERRTVSSVTFAEAIVLDGAEGIQPPGTYLIETVEEPLDSVSFLGFRRIPRQSPCRRLAPRR